MSADELPEQMRVRREKLERLRAEGRDPYAFGYPRTTTNADVRARFSDLGPDQATGEQGARYFLKEKQDVWTKWVPADVADKVKAGL